VPPGDGGFRWERQAGRDGRSSAVPKRYGQADLDLGGPCAQDQSVGASSGKEVAAAGSREAEVGAGFTTATKEIKAAKSIRMRGEQGMVGSFRHGARRSGMECCAAAKKWNRLRRLSTDARAGKGCAIRRPRNPAQSSKTTASTPSNKPRSVPTKEGAQPGPSMNFSQVA